MGRDSRPNEANEIAYEFYSPLSRSLYRLIRVRTAIKLVPN